MDEEVVLLDSQGNPTGTAKKAEVHTLKTPLHRAFSVFLFDNQGNTLMQQRALSKKTWPGVWSNTCCGHPLPGETWENAVARRLQEELGITCKDLSVVLPRYKYRAAKEGIVENEICPVFVGYYKGTPAINPDEVGATKWISWQEFIAETKKPGTQLSPWCVEEAQLLEKSDILNKLLEKWHR